MALLTKGSLAQIMSGQQVTNPVLQVRFVFGARASFLRAAQARRTPVQKRSPPNSRPLTAGDHVQRAERGLGKEPLEVRGAYAFLRVFREVFF